MRTFIKNYIDAKKRQKLEETGEEGFSLIELIVVVVILGILVAIAIPIFLNLQQAARDNALESATASFAVVVAGEIANDPSGATVAAAETANETADYTFAVAVPSGDPIDLTNFCVTGTGAGSLAGATAATAGPGC